MIGLKKSTRIKVLNNNTNSGITQVIKEIYFLSPFTKTRINVKFDIIILMKMAYDLF